MSRYNGVDVSHAAVANLDGILLKIKRNVKNTYKNKNVNLKLKCN